MTIKAIKSVLLRGVASPRSLATALELQPFEFGFVTYKKSESKSGINLVSAYRITDRILGFLELIAE